MPMKQIQIAECPWQQTGIEPDLLYLSKYCSLFLSWMSAINFITVDSCWYAQIWKGWKNLPTERSRAQVSNISKFQLSVEKNMAIFFLPTPVSHFFSSVENGKRRMYLHIKKGDFIVFFHFLRRTCVKSHLFHAIFPKSAANIQQSTLKEVHNWEKRAESYWPITNKSSNQLKAIVEWREAVTSQQSTMII